MTERRAAAERNLNDKKKKPLKKSREILRCHSSSSPRKMSDSTFEFDPPVLDFNDFFYRWSRSVTHDCLPLLQQPASSAAPASVPSAAPASVLSAGIQLALGSLKWYYEKLDSFAKTIPYPLFPTWRESLEMPVLFLGDINPYLLTSLFRSITIKENQHSHEELLKNLEDQIAIKVSVLLDQMKEAHIRFAARFSENWVSTYLSQQEGEQRKTVMETAASVDEAAEEDKTAFARVFVGANHLRMEVIKQIVASTDEHLAALFLEALLGIFAGFNYQDESQNSQPASQLMNDQQQPAEPVLDIPKPVPPHYSTFPIMFPHHPPGPVPPPNYAFPYVKLQQHPPVPANFLPRPVPAEPHHGFPFMNQQQHQPVPAHVLHRAEYAMYVGRLSRGVTARVLGETFRARYQSVRAATVKVHDGTEACAGYGFVSFSDEDEKNRAMVDMNDELFCYERLRTGPAVGMPLSTKNFSSFSWD
ncbi:unnamed protein product [Thlaspi arvense]|uniref:RRM domain-containing protein n=1 Tax=Thlaspi arvense TaxID=13288 RepID=A0AAU9T6G6_THLAR|nr:unnamed protein product [Thlaspi arvense]